jgi:hypothetical protein
LLGIPAEAVPTKRSPTQKVGIGPVVMTGRTIGHLIASAMQTAAGLT